MSQQVRFIEVHGNDGTSHSVSAKHFVQREYGGVVSKVEPSGMRCAHGAIVWRVVYETGNPLCQRDGCHHDQHCHQSPGGTCTQCSCHGYIHEES